MLTQRSNEHRDSALLMIINPEVRINYMGDWLIS